MRLISVPIVLLLGALVACASKSPEPKPSAVETSSNAARLAKYEKVRLSADLSHLTDKQKQMLGKLIEAAKHMEAAFWMQSYGDKAALLSGIEDEATREFARINFGPWDRLADNEPFVQGAGPKPLGAQFYPSDLSKADLEKAAAEDPAVRGLYTMVQRAEDGSLSVVPYSKYFAEHVAPAAALLKEAAALAEEPGLRRYLETRAAALTSDDYFESDMAWMDMKDNAIDVVIGPIETYEDRLIGAKASFEAYVLLKDLEWSKRLQRYAAFLPELQRGLPVDDKLKQETPGRDSDLNAYDVIYYAGDCNAGSKTIAINLPNDEKVQLEKGTRRLQLKNAMRAKFDAILKPISGVVIAPEQRKHITFDAFFANTMFHEVAHGLGIKNTITKKGTVRAALKDRASALEEGKADVLGLYMISSLHAKGELEGDADMMDYNVTFFASIFRSIRFGAASAHGRANLVRFNFFLEQGAFSRDAEGRYTVDRDKMQVAMTALSRAILELQGNGDYEAASEFMERYGKVGDTLKNDLARIDGAGVPVDIVFEQGAKVLGL